MCFAPSLGRALINSGPAKLELEDDELSTEELTLDDNWLEEDEKLGAIEEALDSVWLDEDCTGGSDATQPVKKITQAHIQRIHGRVRDSVKWNDIISPVVSSEFSRRQAVMQALAILNQAKSTITIKNMDNVEKVCFLASGL